MRGRVRVVVPVLLAAVVLLGDAIVAGAEPGFTPVQLIPRLAVPKGDPSEIYGPISCPSTTVCVAGSPSYRGGGGAPSVAVQTDGTWGAPQAIHLPTGAVVGLGQQNAIGAISCSDAATCEAVGVYNPPSSSFLPMAVEEQAGAWKQAIAMPVPENTSIGLVDALSCPAPGSCLAVGSVDATNPVYQDLVWTQTSGVWGMPALLPLGSIPTKSYVEPTGIWCASKTSCQVVGLASSAAGAAAYVWTDTAGTWGAPQALTVPGGDGSFGAVSLSCLTASSCAAIGVLLRTVKGKKEVFPAAATETGGTWSGATALPFPALSPVVTQALLTDVSCAPTLVCVAVGEYYDPVTKALVGGAATWSGDVWSSVGLALPEPVDGQPVAVSELWGVSCPVSTACTALGPAVVGSGAHRRLQPASVALTPVRPVVAPGPPAGVSASPVLHGVDVRWSPPTDDGGAPISSFTATLEPGGKTCTTATEACRFTGLQDGHRYVVSVTDDNGTDSSVPTAASFSPGAAPSTPAGLTVDFSGPVATVSWRASRVPPGEPVLRYMVTLSGGGAVRTCATRGLLCRFGGTPAKRRIRIEVVATDASGTSRPGVATVVSP